MLRRWWIVGGAVLLVVGCDNPAGPDEFRIELTGPRTIAISPGEQRDGEWTFGCNITISARAVGGEATSAVWTGGTIRIHRLSDDQVIVDESLRAEEVTVLWERSRVRKGEPHATELYVWSVAPFRVSFAFTYRVQPSGDSGEARHELRCEPPGPLPSGRYVLRSINGRSLPAQGYTWWDIHYATITFHPNMTYETSTRSAWLGRSDVTTGHVGPIPYHYPAKGVLELPSIVQGLSGGRLEWSGNRMNYTAGDGFGGPPFQWRFEK